MNGSVSSAWEAKISRFGTVRGRIGTAFDSLLVYGTAGFAYGKVALNASTKANATSTCSDIIGGIVCNALALGDVVQSTTGASASNSRTNTGWTIGGGIEGKFSGNWSWKAEYLHVDLGSLLAGNPSTGFVRANFREDIVRVGLNFAL